MAGIVSVHVEWLLPKQVLAKVVMSQWYQFLDPQILFIHELAPCLGAWRWSASSLFPAQLNHYCHNKLLVVHYDLQCPKHLHFFFIHPTAIPGEELLFPILQIRSPRGPIQLAEVDLKLIHVPQLLRHADWPRWLGYVFPFLARLRCDLKNTFS